MDLKEFGKMLQEARKSQNETRLLRSIPLDMVPIRDGKFSANSAIGIATVILSDLSNRQAIRDAFDALVSMATIDVSGEELRDSLRFTRAAIRREHATYERASERIALAMERRFGIADARNNANDMPKRYNCPVENLDQGHMRYESLPRYTEEEYRRLQQVRCQLADERSRKSHIETLARNWKFAVSE